MLGGPELARCVEQHQLDSCRGRYQDTFGSLSARPEPMIWLANGAKVGTLVVVKDLSRLM